LDASYPVAVSVDDGRGGVDTQQFVLQVRPERLNHAPQFTGTYPTQARVGQTFGFFVTATDADGDPLEFSLSQAPALMSITPATGLITWTPTAGQTGPNPVTIKVSDGTTSTTFSFTVTVQAAAPNSDPVFQSTPVTGAVAGVAYQYQAIAQ